MPSLPTFPIDALPAWAGDFVRAAAASSQVPEELPGLMALAAMSAAVATKARVQLWNHQEPLNLWLATVLASGERKSSVVRLVARPIEVAERALQGLWQAVPIVRDEAPVPLATRFDRIDTPFDETRAAPTLPSLASLVEDLAAQYDLIAPGTAPRLLVDDVTSARLVELLACQAGRLAIISPEGALFEQVTRFARAGSADIDDYLRAHAGDTIRRDRVRGGSVVVYSPSLTLAIAPQPDVLRALRRHPSLRGRGLLGRFIWAVPAPRAGTRSAMAPRIDPDVANRYQGNIFSLLALGWAEPSRHVPQPYVLNSAADALSAWASFHDDIERRIANYGDLSIVRDWASKLPGSVARIAGLLHLAAHSGENDACFGRPIERATMEAAIAIGEFAIPHAHAAFELVDGSSTGEDEPYLICRLRESGRSQFTQRDVHRLVQGRIPRVSDVVPILDGLVERGVLRCAAEFESTGGRPRGPVYTWAEPKPHDK